MDDMLKTIIFIVASAINILAYLYLIYKIWRTKSCAGISAKAHILYAVAYTARFSDIFSIPHYYLSHKIPEPVDLVLVCIILSSLFVFFKKTREQQYDTFRVELPVVCCLAMAVLINSRFRYDYVQEIVWAFSNYIEAVAMLPQYHAISEARTGPTHVFRYLIAVAVGQFVHLLHLPYEPLRYNNNLVMASIVLQLIFYFNFLLRSSPYKLQIVKASPEIAIVADQQNADAQSTTKNNIEENISSIVLTPASLLNASKDKANLLKDEEAQ